MRHTNIIYIKLIIKPIALLMLWAVSSLTTVYAQVYPVQVVTEITPPYSVYLSDYTSPGTGKLAVNILLTDVLKFSYPVKLRLVIEGEGITIATSPSYMPEPIILDGGSPLRLAGDEVADYFNPRNLDFRGYSRERFMQTGALPEGIYRIGFQAMDYNKGIAVSLAGSATAWLVLNDPPIFNTPEKNAKLTATEPQSIMFQWMPRHLGSPNSAFSAEYAFELYEVWPDGRNPNEVVASTQPLIEETVTSTSFFYSNTTAAALMPGRGYAYRVQARDVEGRDLFRNKGYSEVGMFKYGDPCDPPAQIGAQSTTPSRATISWEPSAYNTGYYIQYREAGSANGQWYPKTTLLSSVTIDNLKPRTTYEYQVQGQCGTVNSDFSEILSVTTPPKKEAKVVCGLQDPATAIKSTLPLTSLLPGDTISSGSMVTQVTQATGGNGKWTGEGFMHIPFMGVKVHVTFKDITINDKNQVTRGRVVSVYNPGSNFIVQLGGNKPDTTAAPPSPQDTTTTTVTLPSPIDTIVKTDAGEILVITENGDTTTVRISPEGKITVIGPTGETTPIKGDEVTLVEPNGNTTVIDREGNITKGGNPEEVIVNTSSENAKKLKFIIDNDEYANNDSYYTIYNNKELEVKVEIADTSAKVDLTKIKWKLAGKEIASKDKTPNALVFKVNATTLPKFINDLLVLDNLGKTLMKLRINTYYAPIVRFEEGSSFSGEYFFDRGFEFAALAKPQYYDTIQVGKNKEMYFAPVLGLNLDQTVAIKVIINGFTDNVLHDKGFKMVFKPELTGKIKINGLDSLVLDATGLDNLSDITIKAVDFINQESLISMSIKVIITSTREKVGMLMYYCAKRKPKTVKLIYTKFKDESGFPSYLTPTGLSQFLNNNSLNQFFLDVSVDSVHFTSKKYSVTDMNSWTTSQIIDSLNREKFGPTGPMGYSTVDDYFYITSIERSGSVSGTQLGGFHRTGRPGGVQVKYVVSKYNESAKELTAHELGHWLGLPHTFKSNMTVPLIVEPAEGGTKDNFMDYNIRRKKWLKIQLLKYAR